MLDAAVIMAALAGMTTLLAAALLFVDGLRHSGGATLFVAFGLALLLTIGALGAFLYEMMLASIGIRRDASTAGDDEPELRGPGGGRRGGLNLHANAAATAAAEPRDDLLDLAPR